MFVNGKVCKDSKLVKAEDFFSVFNMPGNTLNQLGLKVTSLNVEQIPRLNGISLTRINYAPYGGLKPPHTRHKDPNCSGRNTLCWLCYIQHRKSSIHQCPILSRCFYFPSWSNSLPVQHREN